MMGFGFFLVFLVFLEVLEVLGLLGFRGHFRRGVLRCLVGFLLAGCAIPNDIPFPIRESNITAIEVDGMSDETGLTKGSAKIDKSSRTVTIYVNDSVDISKLKITRFEVSNEASIVADNEHCQSPSEFPAHSFSVAPTKNNTYVDFTDGEASFILRTYQDYTWTVKVTQVIHREVEVEGQVGNAVIDPDSRNVVLYVSQGTDLSRLKVNKFSLGGPHGTVIPDPSTMDSYSFSSPQTFYVRNAWTAISYKWVVSVYISTESVATTAKVFARSVSATIEGTMQNGSQPTVEFRRKGESSWNTLSNSAVISVGASYKAELTGLAAGSSYEYRVTVDGNATKEQTFTTAPAAQLDNSHFDNWQSEVLSNGRTLYNPWSKDGESFWDTGNRGATSVGESNSTPTTDTSTGSGNAANLLSKWIVIKFAAGNIFTGSYLKTDGTNGILSFGRPFTSFPTKLQFDYKYHSATINRPTKDLSEAWDDAYGDYINKDMFLHLKGQPDSCQVYVALTDWDGETYEGDGETYPFIIRTRPSELHLLDLNDDHIIAYAQMTKGEDVSQWTRQTLMLNYRHTDRTPKWIVVVASSSKYGDYFVGGEGSLLNIDNMKLLYE